ncbi:MAG: NfeD family protein [Desulfobacterales bacterium]
MEMMIVMFSPVFALALFLFLPFWTAFPVYIPIFIFGVIVNYKMMKSMKLPIRTGLEEMMGQEALVIDDIDPEGKVRFKNEIWAATAKGERLGQGEKAWIIGSRGLMLVVANTKEKIKSAEGGLFNPIKTAKRNKKEKIVKIAQATETNFFVVY